MVPRCGRDATGSTAEEHATEDRGRDQGQSDGGERVRAGKDAPWDATGWKGPKRRAAGRDTTSNATQHDQQENTRCVGWRSEGRR